jgi:hypothetical protein
LDVVQRLAQEGRLTVEGVPTMQKSHRVRSGDLVLSPVRCLPRRRTVLLRERGQCREQGVHTCRRSAARGAGGDSSGGKRARSVVQTSTDRPEDMRTHGTLEHENQPIQVGAFDALCHSHFTVTIEQRYRAERVQINA